jgi:hypothetical protein
MKSIGYDEVCESKPQFQAFIAYLIDLWTLEPSFASLSIQNVFENLTK